MIFPLTVDSPTVNLQVQSVEPPSIKVDFDPALLIEDDDFCMVIKEDLSELKKDNERLVNEVKELNRRLESASSSPSSAFPSQTISKLTDQIKRANESLNSYEEKFKFMEQKSSSDLETSNFMQETIKKLQSESKEKDSTIELLNQEHLKMKEQIQKLQQELNEEKKSTNKNSSLVSDYEFFKTRCEILEQLNIKGSRILPCPICNKVCSTDAEQLNHLSSHPEIN